MIPMRDLNLSEGSDSRNNNRQYLNCPNCQSSKKVIFWVKVWNNGKKIESGKPDSGIGYCKKCKKKFDFSAVTLH